MILVTGAHGQLASATLHELRSRDAAAVGGTRSPGAHERRIDFDDPASLDFTDVDTLVLISAGYGEDDHVVARHRAAIDAAARDGVSHLVYTSLTGDGDHLGFALAHRVTEQLIRDSPLAWTILRNGLYAELFGGLMTWQGDVLETPFGDGPLTAVARPDLAAAAAIVASAPAPHAGLTYELVGPPITARDVAERLGAQHRDISLGDYRAQLLANPYLLPFQPPMLASIASGVRHGLLGAGSLDLHRLLGRPPADTIAVAAESAAMSRP